jgi:hypothetical protein
MFTYICTENFKHGNLKNFLVSFGNIMSHSAILSVPHWALCDYYLITCAYLTFRRNSGHVSNFFIASNGIFIMKL